MRLAARYGVRRSLQAAALLPPSSLLGAESAMESLRMRGGRGVKERTGEKRKGSWDLPLSLSLSLDGYNERGGGGRKKGRKDGRKEEKREGGG